MHSFVNHNSMMYAYSSLIFIFMTRIAVKISISSSFIFCVESNSPRLIQRLSFLSQICFVWTKHDKLNKKIWMYEYVSINCICIYRNTNWCMEQEISFYITMDIFAINYWELRKQKTFKIKIYYLYRANK